MDTENTKLSGVARRKQIVDIIVNSTEPIPAAKLASLCNVSRQVIVQDVALIRAANYDIISTNRGYIINSVPSVSRVFKVCHTDEQLEEELNAIVDLGGTVENVMVHHKAYGTLDVDLGISSRRKVKLFLESIRSGKSKPLKNITSDYHYHRVSADSESILNDIEAELKAIGFLIEPIKSENSDIK